MRFAYIQRLFLCAALAAQAGCHLLPAPCDTTCVSAKVADRFGLQVGPSSGPGRVILPNGLTLDRHLSEEDAALLALWNNAAFRELLTELGIAHGDLVTAGLLPNPEFIYISDVPHKPLRYALDFPIESLWLRPIRIAAAQREIERVCERLTQAALDLIRDVRQAHADVILGRGRLAIAQEAVRVRGEIARLALERFEGGDISKQESATARIDALTAGQDIARLVSELGVLEERLRNLLGIGCVRSPLLLAESTALVSPEPEACDLVELAVRDRPDVLAAEKAVEAAAERVRLARCSWFRVLGIADATSGRKTGHEFGPAVRFTVPIFNWNQGNIARAEAEEERFRRQLETLRQLIRQEVQQAYVRHTQSRTEFEILERKVRPEVEAAIVRAETSYREGASPYVVVLETTRQYLDTRLRRRVLLAELRRAWADLERGVGRRIQAPVVQVPPEPDFRSLTPPEAKK